MLAPLLVQAIVVKNTPKPQNFTDSDDVLQKLGVIDGHIVDGHKAGIQQDLAAIGGQIAQDDIDSSPTTTVAACRDSVLANAEDEA